MNVLIAIRSLVATAAVVPIVADAQSVGASATDAVRLIPVWAWWAVAVFVVGIVVAMLLSRRKKRTTIIKTRLG